MFSHGSACIHRPTATRRGPPAKLGAAAPGSGLLLLLLLLLPLLLPLLLLLMLLPPLLPQLLLLLLLPLLLLLSMLLPLLPLLLWLLLLLQAAPRCWELRRRWCHTQVHYHRRKWQMVMTGGCRMVMMGCSSPVTVLGVAQGWPGCS